MSEEWESKDWIFPVVMLIPAIIGIVLIVNLLRMYPFFAGLLIGLISGVIGTIIFYRVRKWFKTHRIVEMKMTK